MANCAFCGASCDGVVGWQEDHRDVCRFVTIACPSKAYGCPALVRRCDVSEHLVSSCPVATSACRRSGSLEGSGRTENIIIRFNWEARQCDLNEQLSCASVPMRRFDWPPHYLLANADHHLVQECCPYVSTCRSWNESSNNGTSKSVEQFLLDAPPASPLHPPIQSRSIYSQHKMVQTLRPELGRSMSSTASLVDCSFQRRLLIPIFPHSELRSKTSSIDHRQVADVFEKVDLVVRILMNLPCSMIPMLACVNKSCKVSCEDEIMRHRRSVVQVHWKAFRSQDGKCTKWIAAMEWTKPNLAPPIVDWKFKFCPIGQHLQFCKSKGELRSLNDMIAAAQGLGDAVADPFDNPTSEKILKRYGTVSTRSTSRSQISSKSTLVESKDSIDTPPARQHHFTQESIREFFTAVMSEDINKMQEFVVSGLDLTTRNAGGYTAIELARERGKQAALHWLVHRAASQTR